MGAAGANLFRGADALAVATGATTSAAAARAPSPEAIKAQGSEFFVTTVRITREHWAALRDAATQQAFSGGGKPDASKVLREVLDGWMSKRQ
jgi:hypothetical protein